MSEFLKPQSPLKHKDGAYIYPLTTADQVILENGNRLNTALNNMSSKPKAGFIYPLASSIVPEGFLLCDGAEYSRVQYEELFAAIGTIYGVGDGSTTFNVPNLQTRVPVGAGEGYGLGAVGGEATHTLTVNEMPSHGHTRGSMEITGQFISGSDYNVSTDVSDLIKGAFSVTNTAGTSTNASSGDADAVRTIDFKASRTWTGETSSVGGSQPHNNMQPYTVVNYIIATGKDTGISVSDIIMGAQALPLEIQYGGTGATTLKDVRHNLGVNVRNLLDNSDFTNPINQRGQTSYSGQGYGIDRWKSWNEENVTTVNSGSVSCTKQLWQDIEPHKIKSNTPYTFAACQTDGTILCLRGLPGEETKLFDGTKTRLVIAFEDDSPAVWLSGGSWLWAALYEGEYTAETLPEYQPKGYGAELAECQRYYYQSWTGDISNNAGKNYCGFVAAGRYTTPGAIQFPVTMRVTPTVTVLTHLGEIGSIRDWGTSTSIPNCVANGYAGADRVTIGCSSGSLTAGAGYAYHYTASADL